MSTLTAYFSLGFHHIVSTGALDHLLFLLALAAIYRPADWRAALWVISAFTVGHSFTLALVVTGLVTLPVAWIEFLIPITILATCVANFATESPSGPGGRRRAILAGLFGLVHGAGFAEYLRSLFLERIAVPLVGFNFGIELGQALVLSGAVVLLAAADRLLADNRPLGMAPDRLRMAAVSLPVGLAALVLSETRIPW
jgi:HupE/UreJ protein